MQNYQIIPNLKHRHKIITQTIQKKKKHLIVVNRINSPIKCLHEPKAMAQKAHL